MRKLISSTLIRHALYTACCATALFGIAYAEPTGGVVKAGTGIVQPEIGQTTTIDQSSNRLVIDWQSFDVGSNERVEFNQPGTDAIALNRITNGAPSTIAGQISANGRIFLINRDGVVFTSSANIDINSLLVTATDIADANFMADNFDFDQHGALDAAIINEGVINAATAGLIAFVAPNVENSGLLRANLGKVVLASGENFTLDFFGDDLITFASAGGSDRTGSIQVSGDIDAPEGTIILKATTAREFINIVINVESDLVANSATVVGGKIILSGGENSEINVLGDLDASGRDGGTIDIEGGNVTVASTARLLADGDQGIGDGGSIRVNSTEQTDFAGLASVEPGASSGTGGDIFIDSDGLLIFSGDARAGQPPRAGTITIGGNVIDDDTGGGDTGGGDTGGDTGGDSTGSDTGGGDTGGDSTASDTGGGSDMGGGTPPIIILPPAAADQVADVISEIFATTPTQHFTPEGQSPSGTPTATVIFGQDATVDFSQNPSGGEDVGDSLFCLHGLSNAACGAQ